MSERFTWIYLTSLNVSGSTIISLVANSHPKLVSPGELIGPGTVDTKAFPEGPICSCNVLVKDCPYWQEVVRQHTARGHRWKPTTWGLDYHFLDYPKVGKLALSRPGPHAYRMRLFEHVPFFREQMAAVHERNRSYTQAVIDVAGKTAVLDASKQPRRILHLSRIPNVDLRVVHLVRHPGGYCYSVKRGRQTPVAESARFWVDRNREIEWLLSGFPQEKKIRVSHEEFCDNPQQEMDRIYALAGLESAKIPENLLDITHHVLGNKMRTRGDTAIKRNDAFEHKLSEEEKAQYKVIAGPLARRYGYDL